MAQLEPYRGDYYLWQYVPSLPAAVVFLVLFAAITGAHCFRIFKTRLWFCLPFVIGGISTLLTFTPPSPFSGWRSYLDLVRLC